MSNSKIKSVAIIVPIYQESLSETEKISMKHLFYFLGNYDKFIIAPEKLKVKYDGFKIFKFKNKHFKNVRAYSKLLLTKRFYKKFSDYDYILIYQLDALVFSDQLNEWCNKSYDYIGAPWINSEMKKIFTGYDRPDYCGNGGFSLRNVSKCINVIEMAKKSFSTIFKEIAKNELSLLKNKEKNAKKYFKILLDAYYNSSADRYKYNEDGFWSSQAIKYCPDFNIPTPDIGLKFAFEVGPRYCFKKNINTLPFGCHAWEKYEKDFWLPYLILK